MATTQKSAAASKNPAISAGKKETFGLLANGACGGWEIAVDEATPNADRWWMQIDGPSVSLSFEISSPAVVGDASRFLEAGTTPKYPANGRSKQNGSIIISKNKKHPIQIIRDTEYDDRFFIAVGPPEQPTVQVVVGGETLANIRDALRQVMDDLADE